MTLTTEIILAVGIACSSVSAFVFGVFWERIQWNRLIQRGRLPRPDQPWRTHCDGP